MMYRARMMNTYVVKPKKDTSKTGACSQKKSPRKTGLTPITTSTLSILDRIVSRKSLTSKTKSSMRLDTCEQTIDTPCYTTQSTQFDLPKSRKSVNLNRNLFASIKTGPIK